MLDPQEDRLEFRELFAPGEGYCLDFAIGTTYSCDLGALIGACMTFGLLADPDDEVKRNAISCLHALRKATARLALFCQAGQILRAPKATPLYSLLEEAVFQVCPPKKGKFWPSFHPKVWLARYEGRKKKGASPYYYRMLVQSRNLTFDQSWDICCSLTGSPGKAGRTNQPLIDFFSFLANQKACAGSARQKKMRRIIEELPKVVFRADMPEFNDLEFIPMGIPDHEAAMLDGPLLEGWPDGQTVACDELLLISPFLGKKALQYFCEKKVRDERVLVTRASSLPAVKDLPLDKFRIYTLRDNVVDAEFEGEKECPKEIHAKIYFQRSGNDARLWLGSMNASPKAISDNVEFMCCLHGNKKKLNIDGLLAELFLRNLPGRLSPFQEITQAELAVLPEAPQEPDDSFLRQLAASDPRVEILEVGKEYRPVLRLKNLPNTPDGYELKLSPLLCEEWLPLAETMKFRAVPLVKLSAFYRVRLRSGTGTCERVLKIPTEGIPADREREIIRSILNDRQDFYNYIALLLGDNISMTVRELEEHRLGGSPCHQKAAFRKLYEKMLRAVYEKPEKFCEIEELTKTLGKENLPVDFADLVTRFKEVLRNWKGGKVQ